MDGKPKMISERCLGTQEEILAGAQARESQMVPERTRHLAFGDVAATWATIDRLGLVSIVDEVVGSRRSDAGASVGTYLALIVLNRVVDPKSKLGFADWWAKTAPTGSSRSRPGRWTIAGSGTRWRL